METKLKDIGVEIGKDWGQTKQKLVEMTSAFERRDDFIRWLVEIKLEDEYSLNDLWDEFEKYEQSDETESE